MGRAAKAASAVALAVIALFSLAYGVLVIRAVIWNTSDTAVYVLIPFGVGFVIASAVLGWTAWRLYRSI
jgi:tryptophan-rich sensory protein